MFPAAKRMAETDAERYGGGEGPAAPRQKAYRILQVTGPSMPLESRLRIEAEFQRRLSGGHAFVVTPEMLKEGDDGGHAMHFTESAMKDYGIQAVTYSISKSMCLYCGTIMGAEVTRCKNCGSTTRFFVPTVEQELTGPLRMNG